MGKVYYTKDQTIIKDLVPVITDLSTLTEVGKYISKETPVRLINRNQVMQEDVVLLVLIANGRTKWSAYAVN
jgi:hypothetical protein